MNEHAEVDIDLLADYIGGALDGPDAAEVARLVAEDPRWRETYELLAPGMAEVGAGLQALGAHPEPMPADVAAQLDAALTGAAPADAAALTEAEAHPVPVRDGERHLHVVRGTGSDRPAVRRRRLRWAAPIAAAAGVIAFAAVGFDQLGNTAEDTTSAAGSSAEQAAPMINSQLVVSVPSDDRITTSGTDYTKPALGDEPAVTFADPEVSARSRKDADSPRAASGVAEVEPDPLDRLRMREALVACLEAIAQERGGTPIAVRTVDYARFRGAPAVIVRFVADGVTWAVAAGPDCGTPGRGADSLETLRVG